MQRRPRGRGAPFARRRRTLLSRSPPVGRGRGICGERRRRPPAGRRYTYFLWRGADKDGVSIVCTKQDYFSRIWFLDLTVSEILTHGCRRRRNWVRPLPLARRRLAHLARSLLHALRGIKKSLPAARQAAPSATRARRLLTRRAPRCKVTKAKTREDVAAWASTLPAPLTQYASAFMAHDIDGPGLSELSLEHMAEMGLEQVGHRYTMQRLIREFEDRSEKDLYKAGAFNASQAELDYVASGGGKHSGERDVTDLGFSNENPLGVDGVQDAERGSNPLHDVLKHEVDPLRHRSGMYLRWDPDERATAQQAESAWRTVLAKFDALPMLSAEGSPEQMACLDEGILSFSLPILG